MEIKSALIGTNLQDGVGGFGSTAQEAPRAGIILKEYTLIRVPFNPLPSQSSIGLRNDPHAFVES